MSLLAARGAAAASKRRAAGGTIFSEDWTGTDTDPWPAVWTTSAATNGESTIDGNQGRQHSGTLENYGGYARALLDDQGEADFDLTVDLVIGQQLEHYPAVSFRGDGNWDADASVFPDNGYAVEVKVDFTDTNGWWNVERVDAGSRTSLQSTAYTVTSGDTLHLNVLASGGSVEFRIWKNAESKPGTATYSFTDSTHNTRTRHGLGLQGGGGHSYTIHWDNYIIESA